MKPTDERYQAATRVNAISPEIVYWKRPTVFKHLEGRMVMFVNGENINTLPGS